MLDQNLGCAYSLFTDEPTACAQPWANHLALRLGFSVYRGKVSNSCHVLWSTLISMQERGMMWLLVVAFVQHIGDSSLPTLAGATELLLQNARESEEFGAKVNTGSFNRCWKLRTMVNSERDKNHSFLFTEILILCFKSNTILLGQIPELWALSPKWLKITFVLTSAFPYVMEKGLTISWWLLS